MFRTLICKTGKQVCVLQARNTHIFRHVHPPPITSEGRKQRPPTDNQNYQKYELIEEETETPAGPLKVILLQDVEGIGHQFDVVEVDRETARNDLLLTRKATYASPFDLRYYGSLKEKMKDELAKRIRVPYDYVKIGRELQKLVVALSVSMDNPWTLDQSIILASLRQLGVEITDSGVVLSQEQITGPNFEFEARLIRFYIIVNKQYVVPMLGRISHISADETKQTVYPESAKTPTADQLKKFGLVQEEPYFHASPELDSNFPVFDLMKSRAKK